MNAPELLEYNVKSLLSNTWVAWFGGIAESLTNNNTINDSNWHMVTLQHDGNDLKIYIDGVLDNVNVGVGTSMDTDPADFVFAFRPSSGGERYDGLLDETSIWNRTLLAIEITHLYNNGSGITISNVSVGITLS